MELITSEKEKAGINAEKEDKNIIKEDRNKCEACK